MKHFRKKSLATLTALALSVSSLVACAPTAALKTVEAEYPAPIAEGKTAETFAESDEHWDWLDSYREKAAVSVAYQAQLRNYDQDLLPKLLIAEDENTVCSPLNIYIALAMLSEISDGNTRQQILDVLQVSDMETLRQETAALWNSNYADTPILKSLLADSLWLKNTLNYNEATLSRLAKDYYASSFRGTPGSPEMDQALQQWINRNTGGLLSEYVQNLKLDSETALALVSTIYYRAAWGQKFYADSNTKEIFHGAKGDTTVEMMHQSDTMSIYQDDAFTALCLPLKDSGSMYFYLPKEGTDMNQLIQNADIFAVLTKDNAARWSTPLVNLSLPKFKVSCRTDLLNTLAALGITDAMDSAKANFVPLTKEKNNLFLGAAEHAAMVEVDENGVTGAAYTELAVTESAMQIQNTMELKFDRPFLFLITGQDGSVLFSGAVRNIE